MTTPDMILTDDDREWLSRWRIGGRPFAEWLDAEPPVDAARATLIKAMDRTGPRSVFSRLLAAYLDTDPVRLYAANWPRKAAKLAEKARGSGDHPHADQLYAALIALMYCANCGRPLVDPMSIERGIGPDCWPRIDPAWRMSITVRAITGHDD